MSQNIPDNEKPKEESVDLAAEFAELGKKIRSTVETAWTSEERKKIQSEIKEGLERFVKEVNEAFKSARTSDTGQKVETEIKRVTEDIESGKVANEVRKGLVTGLRSLGNVLDKMADSFSQDEGAPKK
ncbi:MAG: hypothetical protein JXB07_03555 [Anaerolineae bacterium]|nr:hypothetical protein [Anaerolineae bacterium]